MRILYEMNEIKSIEEFFGIDLIEGTMHEGNNSKTDLFISLKRCNGDYDYVGNYMITSKESYENAIKNYNNILQKLLETGYCKSSDFENFYWS